MEVCNVLIDHQLRLQDRREQRTGNVWPDESDIYDMTIMRLRRLFDEEREGLYDAGQPGRT